MIILPVMLVLAAIALGAAAVSSLDGTEAPRVGREPPDGIPVRVLCPATDGTAVVRVAISVAEPACVVVGCDRFPDGVLRCDRECFPLDLMRRPPLATAA